MSTTDWSAEFEQVLRANLPLLEGPIKPDVPLMNLGLDSLGAVSLVMEIEEALDVSIPDELLLPETFASAHALWKVVSSLRSGTAA